MTLTEFLAARLREDEAAAKAPSPSGQSLTWSAVTDLPEDEGGAPVHWVISEHAAVAEALGVERGTGPEVAAHIARHDPARVLREVEAGRKILAEHERTTPSAQLRYALLALAAVYSDHPDYREEWRP